jgi:hypothetical protein
MPRAPRGRSWAAEYATRKARAIEQGFTSGQARGHPEKDLPRIAEARRAEAAIRSAAGEPQVIVEGERVVVKTTGTDGKEQVHVTTLKRWRKITRGRRRGTGPTGRPVNIFDYPKRRRGRR